MNGGTQSEETQRLLAEMRALAADVRDAAQDGRQIAANLSKTIEGVVNLQCTAIEERMQSVLAQLDKLEKKS